MTTYAGKAKKAVSLALAALMVAALSIFAVSQTAIADDTSEATEDAVAFTVYTTDYIGGDETVAKEYTATEFESLITTHETATYGPYGSLNLRASYTYATVEEILADAGITLDEESVITVTGSDGFSTTMTYDTYCDNQYFYPNTTATVEDLSDAISGLPVAITNTYGFASDSTGTYTAQQLADQILSGTMTVDETYRLLVPQNSDNSNYGKVQVSEVVSITVAQAYGRIGGDTRFDTMANIVEAAFNASGSVYSKNIVICTAENYPDALAAAGYAGLDYSAGKYTQATPIVLTDADALSEQAEDEIRMVLDNTDACGDDSPVTITIVGGEGAISVQVESDINDIIDEYTAAAELEVLVEASDIATVQRISGDDRVETAIALYEAGEGWGTTAYVICGSNYPDALSASAAAYANNSPIFLCDGDEISVELAVVLAKAQATGALENVIILGGENAVSAESEEILEYIFDDGATAEAAFETAEDSDATTEGTVETDDDGRYVVTSDGGNVVRVYGDTRYETSSAFADYAVDNLGLSYDTIVVATGDNYPDALAASPLAGVNSSPILLVGDDTLTPCVAINIAENADSITTGYVIGGESAVSVATYNQIESLIYSIAE